MVRYDNMSERGLLLAGSGLWTKPLFDAMEVLCP